MNIKSSQQQWNERNPEVIKAAVKKRQSKHKRFTLDLHKEEDKDLIEWIKSQKNNRQTLKKGVELLRHGRENNINIDSYLYKED